MRYSQVKCTFSLPSSVLCLRAKAPCSMLHAPRLMPCPMRIAIVTQFPRDPAKPHGGVEVVSVNLVRALAKRGDLDVHVVTIDPDLRSPEVFILSADTLQPIAPASSFRSPASGSQPPPHAPCSTPDASSSSPLTPALSPLRSEGDGRGEPALPLSAPCGRGEGSGEVGVGPSSQLPASSSQPPSHAPCSMPHAPSSTPSSVLGPPSSDPIGQSSVFGLQSSDRSLRSPVFTLHRLPASYSSLLAYAVSRGRRQLRAYLRELQPDVVHAHDTYGLMLKGWPGPRVFTIHGFIHEDTRYQKGKLPWLRSWLWRWFETAAWAEQPHIISISPYVRERLRGIARGVIHDIENPIAPECFEVHRAEVPGTVFSAGVLCPRKNTLGLLKAFAMLARSVPEAQLRLAGKASDPGYEQQIHSLISRSGLIRRISLLGQLTPDQVRRELAQASVFALVSFEEGAPMAIEEAMAAGVPVVASNRCGMPYMVRDGETGFLVDPHDPEEIAERLRELLCDGALRQRMGQAGRAFALDRFHPDRVAERIVRAYASARMRRCAGPRCVVVLPC